ncbi:MAG: SixA phosphatase family protein [Planctomycetales bacterium]|jgi:phosphohistidine phosphatase
MTERLFAIRRGTNRYLRKSVTCMKSLIVLRHGKAESPGSVPDFDRSLAGRGTRDAVRVGEVLVERDLMPDLIVASTAKRATTTAQLLAEGCNYSGQIIPSDDLYLPTQSHILATVRDIPEEHSRVVIVGHNPGFGMFASKFGGSVDQFPTCAWAHIGFDVEFWGEVTQTTKSEGLDFWYPKMDE